MKRLSASITNMEEMFTSQIESIRQEYDTYKKRSKAATALLQEKTGSASGQMEVLQNEVYLFCDSE